MCFLCHRPCAYMTKHMACAGIWVHPTHTHSPQKRAQPLQNQQRPHPKPNVAKKKTLTLHPLLPRTHRHKKKTSAKRPSPDLAQPTHCSPTHSGGLGSHIRQIVICVVPSHDVHVALRVVGRWRCHLEVELFCAGERCALLIAARKHQIKKHRKSNKTL